MIQQGKNYIYGKHAVREALIHVPKTVRHVYLVSGHDTEEYLALVRTHSIPYDHCDAKHLPQGADREVVHQGVLALVTPEKILRQYKEFISTLTVTNRTALVLLDELTDPQNVGAVIRSAAAFGAAGVLIPERRQAQITGTVVKVSAGMAFTVPLVQVGNVNVVLRDLKERGFWTYGLTEKGATLLPNERFTKPSVFVLGNESRGIREKTADLCDFKLSIPIDSRCESLNAAVSAGVVLYAWANQRDAVRAE